MICTVIGYFADSAKYETLKTAWSVHMTNFFEGTITIADDGTFKGSLMDRLGPSNVNGTIDHLMLVFKKIYQEPLEPGVRSGEITYLLGRRKPLLLPSSDIALPESWAGCFIRQELDDAFKARFQSNPATLDMLMKENMRGGYVCLALCEAT